MPGESSRRNSARSAASKKTKSVVDKSAPSSRKDSVQLDQSGDRSSHSREESTSQEVKNPPVQSLPNNASLENLRKQAKTLLKGIRANDPHVLAKVGNFHPRESKPRDYSLSDAQLVIARSYGFASWPKLKRHLDVLEEYSRLPREFSDADESKTIVDRFISLGCLTYTIDHAHRRNRARELLEQNPSLSRENIYAAATIGDVTAVRGMLRQKPPLATTRGGPHNWEPLLYAAYSRLNSEAKEHSTLEVARFLLRYGADPNAGFLWDRHYLFTALTGAFGEGEAGPVHQPEHQYCYELARLLLEAGADPNDSQTLYNRMFSGRTDHLELLFEFGLGKGGHGVWFKRLADRLGTPVEMLQQQMAWAAKYNQIERIHCLVKHGVDVNLVDTRFRRTPYELAILHGNVEIAQYLLDHGARQTSLSVLDTFKAACLNADEGLARSLFSEDPSIVNQLDVERVELLNLAAESDRRDAVRLMADLGFDLNELKRTAPLHLAAGAGHLEMVKLLIELGADPSVRDTEFNGTAQGWAEYNERTEVAEFLKQYM